MKFGLQQQEIEVIQKVLSSYDEVQKVILYGSRAKGNFRPASDIDLVLFGDNLDLSKLLAIENELDDLLLPYKIDLTLYHTIDNPDLLDHIKRVGVNFLSVSSH